MAEELNRARINPFGDDGLMMKCVDCRWFRGTPISGVCKGAPPVAVVVGVQKDLAGQPHPMLNSFWPTVGASDFCGQFKRDDDKELEPIPIAIPEGTKEGNA